MAIDWVNGPPAYAGGLDRFGNFDPQMVGTNVGYYGDPGQLNPEVGEVYTAHIVVRVGYPPRGGVVHRTRILLPPNTTYNPGLGVRCYRQRPGEANKIDATNDPGAACVPPTLQPDGTYDFGQRDLPQGNLFEIQFDLQTSAPMNNRLLTGFADSQYGTGPLGSFVGVSVFPRPTPPPTSGRLVFVHDPGFFASIDTANFNGTARTSILSEGLVGSPAWSPDRSTIAFTSYRDGPVRRAQVYLMNADGSNQRRITSAPPLRDMTCGTPKWSPDGTQLLVFATNQGTWQIFTINSDGSNQRQLTFDAAINKTYAAWVPRARRIAYIGNRDLYDMDYSGQNVVQSTFDGGTAVRLELTAHPSHELLAYTARVASRWEVHVWTGSRAMRIADGAYPAFSPDGYWLMYTKDEQTSSSRTGSLYMADLRGQGERLVLRSNPFSSESQVDWAL